MSDINFPTTNSFISQPMRNIRDHMYYGEFCAALDFDDGWKDATYPHFKEYISEL